MKLLIIIDYQNDFVDGSLGFDGAELLDEKIINIIPNYDDIVFTLDTHQNNYLKTEEGKFLPVVHCIKDTVGHEVYGKTNKYLNSAKRVFEKNTFPSLELANWLQENSYDEIHLVGLVSHICVLSNAVMVKSALPNSKIVVLKDLVASYDKVLEQKALDILRGLDIEVW